MHAQLIITWAVILVQENVRISREVSSHWSTTSLRCDDSRKYPTRCDYLGNQSVRIRNQSQVSVRNDEEIPGTKCRHNCKAVEKYHGNGSIVAQAHLSPARIGLAFASDLEQPKAEVKYRSNYDVKQCRICVSCRCQTRRHGHS